MTEDLKMSDKILAPYQDIYAENLRSAASLDQSGV